MTSRSINLSILGLPLHADAAAIKAAFLQLARKHTPESDAERFIQISTAYRELTSPGHTQNAQDDSDIPPEVETAIQAAYSEQARTEQALPSDHRVLQGLRRLLKTHRLSRALRYHLASLLREASGGGLEALTIATELASEPPDDPDHRILLAECLGSNGQKVEALRAFQELTRAYPDYLPGILSKASFQAEHVSSWSAIETISGGLTKFAHDHLACVILLEHQFLIEAQDRETQLAEATARKLAALAGAEPPQSAARVAAHETLQHLALVCLDEPALAMLAMTLAEGLGPVDPEIKETISDLNRSDNQGPGCFQMLFVVIGLAVLAVRCAN